MFNIKYKVPLLEAAQFSTWSIVTAESVESKSTTAFKLSSPMGTTHVVEDLVFHYPPKPFGEPVGRTGRLHNVYVDAYQPWEALQLSAHLKSPQPGTVAASDDFTMMVAKHVYDNRMTLFVPKNRPKSLHDLVSERMKYGRLISDIPLPLTLADQGVPLTGIDLSIVGWGSSVHKAHMVRTSSLKMPERVAYASFHPVSAGPKPEGLFVTDLVLVAPRNKNAAADDEDVCITEVPWRQDGSLYGSSPIIYDDAGAPMWRKIGPQDIVSGSTGAAKFDLRGAPNLYKKEGTLNKRVQVSTLYFRRPATVKPRAAPGVPGHTASRTETLDILNALEVSEQPVEGAVCDDADEKDDGDSCSGSVVLTKSEYAAIVSNEEEGAHVSYVQAPKSAFKKPRQSRVYSEEEVSAAGKYDDLLKKNQKEIDDAVEADEYATLVQKMQAELSDEKEKPASKSTNSGAGSKRPRA
jgi:hypothetical protein